VEEIVR